MRTDQILKKAWGPTDKPHECPPKFSFEYFPPKTEKGCETLYNKVWKMCKQKPLFIDLTWGAGGSTSELTMNMSTNFKKLFDVEVNMHLTCTNITADSVKLALLEAKENGITSICALRGDPPAGQDKWEAVQEGFNCALDLIKFIRKAHGEFFSIAVSGYPEGHPDAIKEVLDESKLSKSEKARVIRTPEGKVWVCHDKDFKGEIEYLKKKVDAGGNLIITQLFYDVDVFLAFVKACRDAGIKVPILPGIMPLMTYGGFRRMTGFCKTKIPDDMEAKVTELKDDEKAFKEYGLELVVNMCKRLWASKQVPALHFYALNQEEPVLTILGRLGVKVNPLDSDADVKEAEEVAQSITELMEQEKKQAEERKLKRVKTSE